MGTATLDPPRTVQIDPATAERLSKLANPFEEDRLNKTADFRHGWDVPSYNKEASDWLTRLVSEVQESPAASASRKIAVFLANAGYGKTHLFGRVSEALGHDVFFAYVGPILEDQLERPMRHILWDVVEALFDPPADGGPPWIDQLLARLCRPSFEAFFDRLPETLRARHLALRQKLGSDPLATLDVTAGVAELAPFRQLGDSVARTFPNLRVEIVRALALGWSPARLDARRWLRGDDLPEQDCERLGLRQEAPEPERVIHAIATLLQQIKIPLIICCDQLEAILKKPDVGPIHLSNGLVGVLQNTPNTLLVLGCMEDAWKTIIEAKLENSFLDRVHRFMTLRPLNESEAVELVHRRVDLWAGNLRQGGTFPIAASSIKAFLSRPRSARALVQACRPVIEDWLLHPGGEVALGDTGVGVFPDVFIRHWNAELTKTRGKVQDPENVEEAQLFQSVKDALSVLRTSGDLPPDVRLLSTTSGGVAGTANAAASLTLSLRVGDQEGRVVVAVSKRDAGIGFAHYVTALAATIQKRGTWGVVLVRPRSKLRVGPTTVARRSYERAVSAGKLRPFPLSEERLAFDQLTCLFNVLTEADNGLTVGGKDLSRDDCIKLIAENRLLKSLKLFDFIFENWQRGTGDAEKPTAAGPTDPSAKVAAAQAPVKPAEPPAAGGARPAAPTAVLSLVSVATGPAASAQASPPQASPVPAASSPAATVPNAPATTADQNAFAIRPTSPSPNPSTSPVNGSGAPGRDAAGHRAPEPGASSHGASGSDASNAAMRQWAEQLLDSVVDKLRKWNLPVRPVGVDLGPTFARLKVHPSDMTDINKVRNKAENMRVNLSLPSRPMIGFQAGFISIDVQLPNRSMVALEPLLSSRPADLRQAAAFPAGMDVGGKIHWLNLAETANCHLLIAGTTGSGKSEFLKVILGSLAMELSPEQLRFILIDPKRVTFNLPGPSPYLHAPIAYEATDALPLLDWCVNEMERRYKRLAERFVSNVSDLPPADAVPRIVVIFDEFADVMLDKAGKKELEPLLKRLGAKARAAGIHLVLGTQRTEASVVTPLLRSNLPGRISLRVATDKDSALILDGPGAAELLGKGDLLWRQGGDLLRLQSPFVSQPSLEAMLRVQKPGGI